MFFSYLMMLYICFYFFIMFRWSVDFSGSPRDHVSGPPWGSIPGPVEGRGQEGPGDPRAL